MKNMLALVSRLWSKSSMFTVALLLFIGSIAPAGLHAQASGVLTNLEVGSNKTDIEYLRFPLDQPLSASRFDYSTIVEQLYTAKALINATVPQGAASELKINGVAVKSGEPFPTELKLGANQFEITVSSTDATSAVYHLTVTRTDLSKEYRSESLGKGIWRILDFGGQRGDESFYLIEGKDKALLLDTGMGKGDLAGFVRTLTSLPVEVAITHGHGDHFGQVSDFKDSTVYISEKDVAMLPPALVTPKFKWVKDGDIIDLGGGRKFEAIEVPGHTLGSTIYLDRADKIAVTGDSVSSGSMVYMFGTSCTALDQYAESLKRLETRVQALDGLTLLVGHHYQERVPLTGAAGKQLFTDMRVAAEKVLAGELTGKQAFTVRDGKASELRQAYVGLAGLWYNPLNLHTAPAALGVLILKTAAGNRVFLKPAFSSFVTNYIATMPDQSNSVDVTPTAYSPNYKSIAVGPGLFKSGGTHAVDLKPGSNEIGITVTGNDGSTRTYSVLLQK